MNRKLTATLLITAAITTNAAFIALGDHLQLSGHPQNSRSTRFWPLSAPRRAR